MISPGRKVGIEGMMFASSRRQSSLFCIKLAWVPMLCVI